MIEDILKKYPFIVLDGAFSTELERQGFSIHDELWSAIALYERPDLVKAVHRSYFDAGSDIVISASYQATLEGFEKKGFSRKEGRELLIRSVQLVQEARDEFLAESSPERRPVPLAAASVGPYGAFLADGSEYKGHYGKPGKNWPISTGSACISWQKQVPISLPVKPFPAFWKPWQRRMCFRK